MKKYFRIVAIVLLIAMSIPLFSSCGSGQKKLNKLLAASQQYYAAGQKAEITTHTTMSGTVSDVNVTATSEINETITTIDPGNDNFTYLDKAHNISKTKIGDAETVEEHTTLFGFVEQNIIKAYIPSEGADSGKPSYLKSPCTVSDFREFLNWRQTELYPNISEYGLGKEVSLKKNKSKNVWEVKISEIEENSKETIENWINASLRSTALECTIEEFSLFITINIDTSAIETEALSIKALYKLDDTEYNLEISSNVKYSLPDKSVSLTPENLADYKETGDLRYIDYATNALNDLNSFSRNISCDFHTSTYMMIRNTDGKYPQSAKYSENDTVNCGVKDGKFVYHIDSEINNNGAQYDAVISYDGRQQSIAVGEQYPQKNTKSESESKSYIASVLFKAFAFDGTEVSDISISDSSNEVTIVVITLYSDTRMKNLFASAGYPVSTNLAEDSAKLRFTFDSNNNSLKAVSYSASGKYVIMSKNYTLSYSVILSDIQEADLSMITVIK